MQLKIIETEAQETVNLIWLHTLLVRIFYLIGIFEYNNNISMHDLASED